MCEAVQDMVDDAREDVLRGAATSSVGDGGIDCVVVARLCASVIVHPECDAPIWKRDLISGAEARRLGKGAHNLICCTTPASLFVQHNAFLDEADGLTERVLRRQWPRSSRQFKLTAAPKFSLVMPHTKRRVQRSASGRNFATVCQERRGHTASCLPSRGGASGRHLGAD